MSIKITPQIEEMARTLCGQYEKTCTKCNSFSFCEFWVESSVLIYAGYRKQEWISVEDDKPKNGLARVIVFVDGYEFEGFPKIDTDRYANGKWVRWGKYVTHWMRSPEPPKKK